MYVFILKRTPWPFTLVCRLAPNSQVTGNFALGLVCSMAGSFCLAASYPFSELTFKLGEREDLGPVSEEMACVVGSLLNSFLFGVWTVVYTVPNWQEGISHYTKPGNGDLKVTEASPTMDEGFINKKEFIAEDPTLSQLVRVPPCCALGAGRRLRGVRRDGRAALAQLLEVNLQTRVGRNLSSAPCSTLARRWSRDCRLCRRAASPTASPRLAFVGIQDGPDGCGQGRAAGGYLCLQPRFLLRRRQDRVPRLQLRQQPLVSARRIFVESQSLFVVSCSQLGHTPPSSELCLSGLLCSPSSHPFCQEQAAEDCSFRVLLHRRGRLRTKQGPKAADPRPATRVRQLRAPATLRSPVPVFCLGILFDYADLYRFVYTSFAAPGARESNASPCASAC